MSSCIVPVGGPTDAKTDRYMTESNSQSKEIEERLAYEQARQAALRGELKRRQRLQRQMLTLLIVAIILFVLIVVAFYLVNAASG